MENQIEDLLLSVSSSSSSSSSSVGSYSFTASPTNSPRLIKDLINDDLGKQDELQKLSTIPKPVLFCQASNITCVHEEDYEFAGIIKLGLMIKHFDLILVSPTKAACKMAGMLGFIHVPKICIADIRPRKDFQMLKIPNLINFFSSQLYPNIDFSLLKKSNFMFIDEEENEYQYMHRLKQFFYSEIPLNDTTYMFKKTTPSLLLVVDKETSRDIYFVGTRLDRL